MTRRAGARGGLGPGRGSGAQIVGAEQQGLEERQLCLPGCVRRLACTVLSKGSLRDRRVPDLLQAPPRPPSSPSAAGTSLLTANCPGATFEYKCYLTFGGVKKTQVGKCVCVTSERATAPSWNGK